MGPLQVEVVRGRVVSLAPLPAGSVTIYDASLHHRGGGHTSDQARHTFFVSLMDESGLSPIGLPYTIRPAEVDVF